MIVGKDQVQIYGHFCVSETVVVVNGARFFE